ncbi:MAG: NifB/NifX family molybdenum-iron cluster-binding protein [Candidatus Pacebacteria bacterium]|nr:NifB/NifX family molybdenum-iron cluster-binding protein [Candidatus Paceibacterota bacterium]
MKIVIPTNNKKGLDDKVAEHFGRCLTYTFLNEKGEVLEIIDNTSEHNGGQGLPPELMKKYESNILLCKGLGSRALDLCTEFGIDVFVYQTETVRDIFELWKNNKLELASKEDACKH